MSFPNENVGADDVVLDPAPVPTEDAALPASVTAFDKDDDVAALAFSEPNVIAPLDFEGTLLFPFVAPNTIVLLPSEVFIADFAAVAPNRSCAGCDESTSVFVLGFLSFAEVVLRARAKPPPPLLLLTLLPL